MTIFKATLKWGAFCGQDPLQTRTAIRFQAASLRDAKRIAKETLELNPDWMLETIEPEQSP